MKVYFKGWLTVLALALGALVMITLATQPTRAAGPWYVAPGGNDSSDCLSPTTACATINGALNKPGFVAGDTIRVATGTYTSTGDEVVLLNKNATLSGGWDTGFTTQSGTSTIDGEGARRGITVNSGVTAMVERFTVQNGDTGGDGGGIYNAGTLTLNNSTISGNTAGGGGGGGGINNYANLTLNNSTVSSNTATYFGGGIHNSGDSGTVTLNNSTISGNTASEGGGINNWYGTVTLNNSTVSGNTAGGGGGVNNYANLTLNNSTVSGNTAGGGGGGILNWSSGTLTLNNSTVSGNTAGWRGGGICNDDFGGGTVTLNNSTVSGNTANDDGGGIYNARGPVTLQNTILAGNTGDSPDCLGTIGSSGYNLIGDTSGCTFTPTDGDLTNVDPKLGLLQDNGGPTETHALLPGSPAIDHIPPGACPATDQRGVTRPLDGDGDCAATCDIGALEAPALLPGLVYDGHTVDDDNNGQSSGDGDGVVECGETIELYVTLRNQGDGTACWVNATISTSDSYITWLHNTSSSYPDIPGGGTGTNSNDFDFAVNPCTPDGHVITFCLDPITASNGGPWSDCFDVPVTCVDNPPNTPGNPSPADGTANQDINVDLSWTGGDPDPCDTVTYDVYFEANDSTPDNLICNDVAAPTCDPGTLAYDSHYYWYVVATDNHGVSTTGDTWDFFTMGGNTPPTISDLPDQTLPVNTSLDNAIDLWAYADDAESADSELTFTIDNTPDSDAGVSIDSNRYIDINPTPGWTGQTDVTIRVTDPGGLSDTNSFQVTVKGLVYLPIILKNLAP